MGYPTTQLKELFTKEDFDRLMKWMNGQTGGICDGRRYDHEKGEYFPTHCGPHGFTVYMHDLDRFLKGQRIIDW